ncbi:hypothetical protein CPB84DRAFT_972701 [Gymnopilus junonius]|uniref:Berberine/berberine-like domain-containing protein n=1 Tax=Gymnopilus junonius TaxID=109634 RepID=A0A9P5N846_GYMJU|nr:hypothetical protein CPB84DRAFT_972701 [Gymnopilus junonius]
MGVALLPLWLHVVIQAITHPARTTNDATSRKLLTYSVEPFLPNVLSHGSPSAYPSNRSVAFSPFPIYDAQLQKFTKTAAQRIQNAAEKDGIVVSPFYPNYAITDTPLEAMHGENVEKLKKIKARVDPSDVMGLAGGFKF